MGSAYVNDDRPVGAFHCPCIVYALVLEELMTVIMIGNSHEKPYLELTIITIRTCH